jgi:predicted unusual protein kinase regulating ubiquinone biosynthesis (AarF/ABC1/UbiB family)
VASDPKDVPVGRLTRLSKLAGLGLRSGASMLLARDGEAAATQAAEVLGKLRGIAAKVGQMASYVDGFVPEAQREHYERALRGLRSAAAQSPPAAIARIVETELGAPMDTLFAHWEEQPFASASIGQVHRARMHDGRDVAVKVQHPGIERAIDSDLENGAAFERVVAVLGPKLLDSRRMYNELSQRIREELDYRLEAERQARFAQIHRDDPDILIPAVIEERSSGRVLTSELVQGETLEWAAQQPDVLRRQFAEVLWRFVFRGNLVGGLFNADPHPGNYLFRPDGTIAFLDFGCVQPISPERLRRARALHLAARRGDELAFNAQCVAILGTRGGSYERLAIAHSRMSMEPLFSSPFHMTREFVAQMVKNVMGLKDQLFAKDKSYVPMPEGLLFMNRLQFGFYSVLARLDTTVDYRDVEETLCREAKLPELTTAQL